MRATMVGTEVISDAVRLACRAPSLHNSQPWSLAIEGDTVSLFADADRVVRAADSSGREALLACGALLDHFRVAMAAAGFAAKVDRLPRQPITCSHDRFRGDGVRHRWSPATRECDSAATH